ncbi:molybdopterin-guanine dinucleotide biosynthesis protein B [Tepidicaulis sp. LMO-SS28]|uniref:molybdopterin-guanine dinucleotide biosynthesis protein B n=1 Tax=Tepidicaulis sp. LMO-SS28 TaxID=3447455 RepID=UPI003EE35B28
MSNEAQCPIFCFSGWKDSGKTSLMESVIRCLSQRGYSVAAIKHAHHDFDIDKPGKDSYRHRQAGARQVIVSSARRWALMSEYEEGKEHDLRVLAGYLAPADIILAEGYKKAPYPKLQVLRAGSSAGGADLLQEPHLVAVATDMTAEKLKTRLPLLPLNDPEAVSDFIVAHCALAAR